MEQTDLERIEQQIHEFELIERAGKASEHLVHIVCSTPYEDLDMEIAKMLGCSLPEANMIRHLTLDRLSPYKIARISAELEVLRRHYADQQSTPDLRQFEFSCRRCRFAGLTVLRQTVIGEFRAPRN